jgi:hypothetical protein
MAYSYTKHTWEDLPSTKTPITAAKLTEIEEGIYQANENKVDKVSGKDLSTNDLTNALVSKINSASNYSHTHSNKSVLDSVTSTKTANWDTAYSNSHTHNNKSVLDKLSQSTSGSLLYDGNLIDTGTSLIDDDVSSLTKTYSSSKINALLEPLISAGLQVKIVESLPEKPDTKTIYLIKQGETNIYSQYMYIDDEWSSLGDTEANIDLSDYMTTEQIQEALLDLSALNKEFVDGIEDLPEEPDDDTIYFIPDGSATVTEIDDEQVSKTTTYSSDKIENLFADFEGGGDGTLNKEFVDGIEDLPEEPDDDTIYFIPDGSATVTEIDDSQTSERTTYSSTKIEELLKTSSGVEIDDDNSSTSKTYSSSKINSVVSSLINNSTSSTTTTYSSSKINSLINNISTGAKIDDSSSTTATTTTYSANKINSLVGTTVSGTLSSSATSLTLSNSNIKTTSMIDIYTNNWDVYPTAVTVSSGSIKMTFDAPGSSVTVKVVIKN